MQHPGLVALLCIVTLVKLRAGEPPGRLTRLERRLVMLWLESALVVLEALKRLIGGRR